ncbi:bifunctional (p)ppGpp synthetase/guanosine-3',5'-bis(diphosphate) 3'-pyrophosphohydrolase [Candidatus Woesearchaeota archaeon]|nr:bifunctional (p)ppGpp synthetase/guanosine-3',5'-bis(diphosphate) 3'-pyrophosphohydrolase [Candidatus Woesearchaeota archaeon]
MTPLQEALAVAFEAHADQRRKASGVPFIVHPLRVAEYLIAEGAEEHVVVAALLHDVLEDTLHPRESVERFGPGVLRLVDFCTEPGNEPGLPDEQMIATWNERKEHAIHACEEAQEDELLLKLADALANLSSLRDDLALGVDVWEHLNAPKEDQAWYYHSLGEAFRERLGHRRLYRLYERAFRDVFP